VRNKKITSRNIRFRLILLSLCSLVTLGASAQDSLANQIQQADCYYPASDTLYSSAIFEGLEVNPEYGSTQITWTMDYDAVTSLKENGYQGVVHYTSLSSITTKSDGSDSITWSQSEYFDVSDTKLELVEIAQGESYKVKVGVIRTGELVNPKFKQEDEVWSVIEEFSIDNLFGIFDLLVLIGALCFFIYGMKIMSEGIQKLAGNSMRKILGTLTKNRFAGVFTGFTTTALIQSSSATTVMLVSFVNAGLLSLTQSIGVIMGANIGTTITAWLITLLGFKVKISVIALPLIGIGFPMLFSSKGKMKAFAEFIIGFAILFLGLAALKSAVPDIKHNPEVLAFLKEWTSMGFLSTVLFVLVGTILTVVVQSSSAAMTLTLVLCANGTIPFEAAAAMVLGENIGTTITANLAAMVGNVHAKRTARAHFIFNIVGVIWMLIAFEGFMYLINQYMVNSGAGSPYTVNGSVPTAISIFHTTFNILNALFLIWWVNLIAKLVTRMVPSKGDADEEFRLEYISTGLLGTPELSIMEAKKEVAKFGKITNKMSEKVRLLLSETDRKKRVKLHASIKKYEEITDRIEIEITNYLGKVSQSELTSDASIKIRGMLSISNDLERIGDIYYQMSKGIERKNDEKIWFSPEQRERLEKLMNRLDDSFHIMSNNLNAEYGSIKMDDAIAQEIEINRYRNEIRKEHLESMQKEDYNMKSGMIYSDLFSSLEKVGDHVINVSEAVAGEI
jgi:phosphate:Na+ symporter